MHTILLVDDGSAGTVGAMLERSGSGYGVIAADGPSAMAVLQGHGGVDIVIVECRIPGMNELLLLRRIREWDQSLPVILLTGYIDLESYLAAAGLGVQCSVGKPVGLRDLRRAVSDAVGKGSCARSLRQVQTGHAGRASEGG